jgi:hypothetical protein
VSAQGSPRQHYAFQFQRHGGKRTSLRRPALDDIQPVFEEQLRWRRHELVGDRHLFVLFDVSATSPRGQSSADFIINIAGCSF